MAAIVQVVHVLISVSVVWSQDHFTIGVLHRQEINELSQNRIEAVLRNVWQFSRNGPDGNVDVKWRNVNNTSYKSISNMVCGLAELGVSGIVSSVSYGEQRILGAMIGTQCVPHVATGSEESMKGANSGFTVTLMSKFRTYSRIIEDIVNAFEWKDICVVVDENYDRREVQDFLFRMSANLVSVTLRDQHSLSSTSRPVFIPDNWFFIGSLLTFTQIITQHKSLFNARFWWTLLIDTDPGIIRQLLHPYLTSRVVLVKPNWEDYYSCFGDICSECPASLCMAPCQLTTEEEVQFLDAMLMVLKMIENTSHKNKSVDKLICPLPFQNPPSVCPENISLNVQVPTCSGLETEERDPLIKQYRLFTVDRQRRDRMKEAGSWKTQSGLKLFDDKLYSNLFYDFGNQNLVVTATEAPPFVMKYEEDGVIKYHGFSIDLLNEIAVRMKFNYSIREPPDDFYGGLNPDGTWNGMVGMVYRGEVEMAIGPFTITSQRGEVVGFTKPFLEGSTGIITRSPGFEGGKGLFQTLKPFSTKVWLTIVAVIFLISMVSYCINTYTPHKSDYLHDTEAKEMQSFAGNIWMMYASITEQGVEIHPHSMSGRCVLGFWWVFTVVVVAAYTANLTAVLTVFIPPAPIGSLTELLDQDVIEPIVQDGTSFQTLFQDSKDETYQQLWQRLKDSPRIARQAEITKVVESGKYAYIADTALVSYIASLDCQTFAVAEDNFDVVGYGIVIPKQAPYTETINHIIIKMQESGVMDKWRRRWYSSDGHCESKNQGLPSRLGLDSLGGLFLIYLGSAVIASICYVVEFIVKRRLRLSDNQQKLQSKSA